MRHLNSGTIILAAFLTVSWTSVVEAQQVPPEPSAGEIGALLRAEGRTGNAIRILTQQDRRYPSELMNEVADTLAQIAISLSRSSDFSDVDAAMTAVSTLSQAGVGEQGTPYAGAAERLLRIAENAEPGISGGALSALSQLPDKRQVLTYLRRVAVSDDQAIAYMAVGNLGRYMGPEGLEVLRDLHRAGLVKEPLAQRELDALARYHGWK